jgi:hypothetical protein
MKDNSCAVIDELYSYMDNPNSIMIKDQYYEGWSDKGENRMMYEICGNMLKGTFVYKGKKPLECAKRIENALYSPQYTPREVLEMWDICGKEYSVFCGKTCDGIYASCSECIDVTDNEMLLNFLIFMGCEI